jgi:hypothetical protein
MTEQAKDQETAKAEKKEFTAADAVKAFGKRGITVRVPKTGKDGKPVRGKDEKTGRDAGFYITDDQDLAPNHLLSFRKEGRVVTIVTVDGARYRSDDAAE